MILAILWSVFVIFGLAAYLSSDEHGFAQYIGIALGVVLVVGHLAWAFVLLRRRTRASHG
jgi:fumarate reductase subunit C